MSATSTSSPFARHAKIASERARKRMGAGWDMVSAEIQEALVLREAALLVMAQADEEKYGAAQDLIRACWEACPEVA